MKDVIVITGASSGFGALAARALAPAISPASTQSSRSPWRPSRRAGRRKAQERACVSISPSPLNILVPMRPHFSHL